MCTVVHRWEPSPDQGGGEFQRGRDALGQESGLCDGLLGVPPAAGLQPQPARRGTGLLWQLHHQHEVQAGRHCAQWEYTGLAKLFCVAVQVTIIGALTKCDTKFPKQITVTQSLTSLVVNTYWHDRKNHECRVDVEEYIKTLTGSLRSRQVHYQHITRLAYTGCDESTNHGILGDFP